MRKNFKLNLVLVLNLKFSNLPSLNQTKLSTPFELHYIWVAHEGSFPKLANILGIVL